MKIGRWGAWAFVIACVVCISQATDSARGEEKTVAGHR